jgi:proteasome assembly chaperone (PAC2) family protein
MSLYDLQRTPELDAPVLVAALEGWVDAGTAGTMAAEQLAGDGESIATFDSDALYDYRFRRPTLDIVDGRPMRLDWPSLRLSHSRVADRDLLVLRGPEPGYRWHELSRGMVELARRLGVVSWVSLGAIPAAVPHTRPVPILATSSVSGLLPDGIKQGPTGLLRVPAAALSVLEVEVAAAGIPAIGLFAQVPHYVTTAYPNAAIALLTALGEYLGIEVPVGSLATAALERRSLLDAATAADDDARAHVERLELLSDQSRLPEGDELIADIERFLREQGSGSDPGDAGDSGDGGESGESGGSGGRSRLH